MRLVPPRPVQRNANKNATAHPVWGELQDERLWLDNVVYNARKSYTIFKGTKKMIVGELSSETAPAGGIVKAPSSSAASSSTAPVGGMLVSPKVVPTPPPKASSGGRNVSKKAAAAV